MPTKRQRQPPAVVNVLSGLEWTPLSGEVIMNEAVISKSKPHSKTGASPARENGFATMPLAELQSRLGASAA